MPDSRRRWALADEAMELARAAGDPRGLALVLRNAGYALWAPDTLRAAARDHERVVALRRGYQGPRPALLGASERVRRSVQSSRSDGG